MRWGDDWWQATAKRIRIRPGPGSISSRAVASGQVYVSYVGGSEDDDEWISVASGRLRKPQEDFADDAAGDARALKSGGGMPHRGGGRGRKAGSGVGGGVGEGVGGCEGEYGMVGGYGDRRSGGSQSDKWVWLGDEIIEALRDGPLVESAILDRVGPTVKRKRKLQALGRLVAGDFLVRQGLGTVVDPHRYFVPDDDWEEGSAVPFIHPHAQLHARLLQQACVAARSIAALLLIPLTLPLPPDQGNSGKILLALFGAAVIWRGAVMQHSYG